MLGYNIFTIPTYLGLRKLGKGPNNLGLAAMSDPRFLDLTAMFQTHAWF